MGFFLIILWAALLRPASGEIWHVVSPGDAPSAPDFSSVVSLAEAARRALPGDAIVLPRGILRLERNVLLRKGVEIVSGIEIEAAKQTLGLSAMEPSALESVEWMDRTPFAEESRRLESAASERREEVTMKGEGSVSRRSSAAEEREPPVRSTKRSSSLRSETVEAEKSDCEALQKLFESTGGEQWIDNRGWHLVKEGRCCDDEVLGVICEDGRVVSL